jgi:hypothetical protein
MKMTAFQKAEALAGQRYDRDKLLSVVHEVTTFQRYREHRPNVDGLPASSTSRNCSACGDAHLKALVNWRIALPHESRPRRGATPAISPRPVARHI